MERSQRERGTARLELENRQVVDQLDHPALRLIAARPELFTRQGSVAATWRRRGGKTFGPYYRLSYREGGRQLVVYLGRAGALVERVRQALGTLQRPLEQMRALNHMERQIRAALRVDRLHVSALLRPYGLRLKGFEVRGWRFSTLRKLLPRRPLLAPRIRLRAPRRRPRQDNDPASRIHRFLAARASLAQSRAADAAVELPRQFAERILPQRR